MRDTGGKTMRETAPPNCSSRQSCPAIIFSQGYDCSFVVENTWRDFLALFNPGRKIARKMTGLLLCNLSCCGHGITINIGAITKGKNMLITYR